MNIQQKLSVCILGPAFAFALGHTVYNKINMNKEVTKTEVLPDIKEAIKTKSKAAATYFQAQQNLLNEFKSRQAAQKEFKDRIKVFEQNESSEFRQSINAFDNQYEVKAE